MDYPTNKILEKLREAVKHAYMVGQLQLIGIDPGIGSSIGSGGTITITAGMGGATFTVTNVTHSTLVLP